MYMFVWAASITIRGPSEPNHNSNKNSNSSGDGKNINMCIYIYIYIIWDSNNTVRGYCLDVHRFEESLNNEKQRKLYLMSAVHQNLVLLFVVLFTWLSSVVFVCFYHVVVFVERGPNLGDSKNTVGGYCLDIPRFEESLNNEKQCKIIFEERGI